MLAAMRRASSRVSKWAAGCAPPRLVLEIDVGESVPVGVTDDEAILAQLHIRVIDRPWRREAVPNLGVVSFRSGLGIYPRRL
jgi:hypothetical protein